MISSMQEYNQDNVTYGKITFKKGLTLDDIKDQIGSLVIYTHSSKWTLCDQKHHKETITTFFNSIEQCDITTLNLNRAQNTGELKLQFLHIKFCHLQNLSIKNNGIKSIEKLIHLQAPHLKLIWLDGNLITEVRSLRKMFVPELQWLSLSQNFINDYSSLSQLQSRGMTVIEFEPSSVLIFPFKAELFCLNWLFKVQSCRLLKSYLCI